MSFSLYSRIFSSAKEVILLIPRFVFVAGWLVRLSLSWITRKYRRIFMRLFEEQSPGTKEKTDYIFGNDLNSDTLDTSEIDLWLTVRRTTWVH